MSIWMKRLSPIYFIPLFLVIAAGVQAQNNADTIRVKMREIVVSQPTSNISSIDAPLALSLHSRPTRERTGSAATSLSSITQQLPGVWASSRQTKALGGRLLIRGAGWRSTFGVRGVQVVLNGIPLTMADGSSVLNIIDPDVIKDLEVIRGPSSTYWGNSSGGVLYLSSLPDYSLRKNFRIRLYGGSFGLMKELIQYHQKFGPHKISAYSSYQSENGYRDYSRSKIFRAGLQGSTKLSSKSHLEYSGAFFTMPEAENPSGLTAGQVKEDPKQANSAYVHSQAGKQARQGQLGLKYYHQTSAGLVKLTGYGIFRNLTNPLPFAIIRVNRLAGGFRGTLQKEINHLQVKGGFELKTQNDDRHEYQNNGGRRGMVTVDEVEKVNNKAIFGNAAYQWNHLIFKGGIRYDWLTFETDAQKNANAGKRTFHAFSPSFGIGFRPGFAEFYASLSTAFEAPTTTELTNRPGGGNGFNPNLQPEHSLDLEIGTRGHIIQNSWMFDAAFYRMWVQNLLFPYQLKPNGEEFYRNEGKTRHSGLELSTTITPISRLTLKATYNFIVARFRKAQTLDSISLKDKNVPGIPRNRLNMSLAWSPAAFWIQLKSQFVSSYPVNEINSFFNDAYWLFDAKISYQYSFGRSNVSMVPFINLNNILGTVYNGAVSVGARGGKFYYPAPGFNWQAGISFTF
jgi:iron complex outermembrane receptor protein